VLLSAPWGTTSLGRSIERPFDLEELDMTACTAYAASVTPIRAARGDRRHRVRVTRRGRLILVLSMAVLLLAAFSLGRTRSDAAQQIAPRAPLAQTTVHAGDTLWSVAKRIAPQNDPRDVVEQIREVNHLGTAQLKAGQQLLLPRAA